MIIKRVRRKVRTMEKKVRHALNIFKQRKTNSKVWTTKRDLQ